MRCSRKRTDMLAVKEWIAELFTRKVKQILKDSAHAAVNGKDPIRLQRRDLVDLCLRRGLRALLSHAARNHARACRGSKNAPKTSLPVADDTEIL